MTPLRLLLVSFTSSSVRKDYRTLLHTGQSNNPPPLKHSPQFLFYEGSIYCLLNGLPKIEEYDYDGDGNGMLIVSTERHAWPH